MWTKKVGRKELAEILLSERLQPTEGLTESGRAISPLSGWDEVELLWKNDPTRVRSLPAVLLVEHERQRDLLAWVGTYVPSIRPLTAYCRVTDRQTAQHLLAVRKVPNLGTLEDACIGLILGETATHVAGRRDLRHVLHTACMATLSYAIARAASLGLDPQIINGLPVEWLNARTLCRAPSVSLSLQHLGNPWSVLSQLAERQVNVPKWTAPDPLLVETCSQILSTGEIGKEQWRTLTADLPELVSLQSKLAGPREERATLFELAANALRARMSPEKRNEAFLCAYLASSISPGTLDHIHLLGPYLPSFPDLLLWYGLCAGLTSHNTLLTVLNGLGRRLKRELVREDDFLNPPTCDIAVSELAILSTSAKDTPEFRTASFGQVMIELLPSVTVYLRSGRAEESALGQADELASALREIEQHIARADDSLRRARQAIGPTDKEHPGSYRKPKRRQ